MSKVVSVQVHNLGRLINKINRLERTPDLTKPMQQCVSKVQNESRRYLTERKRVKTGTLRRGVQTYVHHSGDNTIGVVYDHLSYAAPVHFGHKVMGGAGRKEVVGMVAPTPFLTVGMERSETYINERIKQAILEHNREAIQ